MTAARASPDDFSLMAGGPFFRAVHWMRLEPRDRSFRRSGLRALAGLLVGLLPALVLSAFEGRASDLLSSRQVRAELLMALPALLAGLGYVNGRIAAAARIPALLELLSEPDLQRHRAALARWSRRCDSRLTDLALVVLAYLMSLVRLLLEANLPAFASNDDGAVGAAGIWYLLVSYPLLWFVSLWWAARFIAWAGVLIHLSKLDLHLVATHADGTGGLGALAASQTSFSVAVFAFGSVVSSAWDVSGSLSEGVLQYARGQAIYVLIALTVVNLPLLAFVPALLRTKRAAAVRFSALVARHARAFEEKWFDAGPRQQPLGAPDMSSQADIGAAFEQARRMRWFPVGLRPAMAVVVAGMFLPLVPGLIADRQFLEALKIILGQF